MAERTEEKRTQQPEDFATVTVPKSLLGPIAKLFERMEAKQHGLVEVHMVAGEIRKIEWREHALFAPEKPREG